jgi:hypothetical protein
MEEIIMTYIDPVEVSGPNYKLLMENDAVKVLEMNRKAGISDIEHSRHDETVYFITGGKVKVHIPDDACS